MSSRPVRRRIFAALSTLGLVGTLALGVATPAQAISFGAITCTASVQWPHGSTHVSGTINVVSSVNCSQTMNEIYQMTYLYRTDGAYWPGKPFDKFNVKSGQSNAATSCSQGPATF